MPMYEYTDEDTGMVIHARRTVEDRNKPLVFKRSKRVPDRVGVLVPGASPDSSFNATMRRAYHRKEEKEGSRFRSTHSKKTISRAWEV